MSKNIEDRIILCMSDSEYSITRHSALKSSVSFGGITQYSEDIDGC